MELYPSRKQFEKDPASNILLESLLKLEAELGLQQAVLYHNFPLYRDDEGGVIVSDTMLLSPHLGVIPISLTAAKDIKDQMGLPRSLSKLEQVPPYVHSRLIRNKALRKGSTQLAFDIHPLVFAPLLEPNDAKPGDETPILVNQAQLRACLLNWTTTPLTQQQFTELVATIDGAKGIIRPSSRTFSAGDPSSKGRVAAILEAAITSFDQQQKHGIMGNITGPQRIRGLAGSGKTVVLAMKAAQTHLLHPEATIAYTFSTKSLYQHVKRLITRFYRQFDDRDPNWDKLLVLHAWGGSSMPGIYSAACERHGVQPISFTQAAARSVGDKFAYVCSQLMSSTPIQAMYDYLFLDEGQDFQAPFLQLCHSLTKDGRFVLAYDELQTLFQVQTPGAGEIFGTDEKGRPKVDFEEDVVLHKCYRNPREVLVCAHALGFGIYGPNIVQMLENKDHWHDLGYDLVGGELKEGSLVELLRPEENSLKVDAPNFTLDSIVQGAVCDSHASEVETVATAVAADIKDGLQSEDILIVVVDDRNAKAYLRNVETILSKASIFCNNLHEDAYGIRDFSQKGRVTLATVHKAKGNEAFMVYVLGVDAVMRTPDVRRRNMLFTAMTRAKGWVRLSGVGESAALCMKEMQAAKGKFPKLVFKYPSEEQLKMMKRDLAESADKKLKARRLLDEMRSDGLTYDEIQQILREERESNK